MLRPRAGMRPTRILVRSQKLAWGLTAAGVLFVGIGLALDWAGGSLSAAGRSTPADRNPEASQELSGSHPATVPVRYESKPAQSSACPSRLMIQLNPQKTSSSEAFAIHVFLNAPDATRSTPLSDPRYVGTVSLFQQTGMGKAQSFSLRVRESGGTCTWSEVTTATFVLAPLITGRDLAYTKLEVMDAALVD